MTPGDVSARRTARTRLLLLAFLLLFCQLALIRWLGANVLHLSFVSNYVLLGAFLGIGIGFLRARSARTTAPYAPLLLCGLVVLVTVFPVEVAAEDDDVLFTGVRVDVTGPPLWVTLPAIFLAVALVMASIAEAAAREFARLEALEAYRIDVLGSLAGIGAFAALSFAGAPPVVWGLVVALLLGGLLVPREPGPLAWAGIAALVVLVGVLARESAQPRTTWSPYYEVSHEPTGPSGQLFDVRVNGVGHQQIEPGGVRLSEEPFYLVPFSHRASPQLGDVLVIGAGSGTDVAIALARGARRVDAVEIDPELHALGERLHPDRPWADPRVHVHIGDGRAHMQRTDRRYDVILFALTDSLTLVSGQGSLRLESYLLTREAMERAAELLKPGGTFSIYNYFREDWLVDRLAGTLAEAFGRRPCVFRDTLNDNPLAVLTVGRTAEATRCPGRTWAATAAVPPAVDDRPFPYLRGTALPSLYVLTLLGVLAAAVVAVRLAGGPLRRVARHTELFLMGAAFLLLETKGITEFALLFGTTWFVNALVFAAILLAVLASIEIAARWRPARRRVLYAALGASLLVAWAVPRGALLELGAGPRFVAAGALAFTPVLLAGLLFADRFRAAADSTTAFGANLLGAMAGGVLEYAALLVGYRNLVVLAAALYAAACVVEARGRSHRPVRARAPAGTAVRATHGTSPG